MGEALRVRDEAAAMSAAGDKPTHRPNGDERADTDYAMSFTKGLPHNYVSGLVRLKAHFEQFVHLFQNLFGQKLQEI